MALKNLYDMVKADRYTQDGREAIIKAQEEETEDKVYQIGEISQKTGLQKTANGWVKPKSGKQTGAKKEEVNKSVTSKKDEIWKDMKKREGALRAKGMTSRHFMDDPEYAHLSELYKNEMEAESKPKAKKPDNTREKLRKFREASSKKQELPNDLQKQAQDFVASATPERIERYIKALRTPFSRERDNFENPDKLAEALEVELKKTEGKSAAESIGRDEKLNKVRQVLNTALTPSGDKVQMTKSKVTGDFHVLLNGKSTGGGFRDPQKAKEEFNAWIAGKKAPSESAKERINKRFDESEARSQKAMESKPVLSQTDGKGNKVEIKITESKGGGFYIDKYVNGKHIGINNANTRESAEAKAKSMMEQHMADPEYRAESKPAADFTKYKRDTGLDLYGKSAQEGEQYMKENGFELQPESRPDRKVYKNGFGEKYEASYTPEGVFNGGSHSNAPIPGRDNHKAYQEGMGNKYLGQKKREDGTVTQVYLTPEGKYERSDFTAKGEYNGGSTSSEEFYKKWYNDDLEDAAPRILTGDTRIRVRKA